MINNLKMSDYLLEDYHFLWFTRSSKKSVFIIGLKDTTTEILCDETAPIIGTSIISVAVEPKSSTQENGNCIIAKFSRRRSNI